MQQRYMAKLQSDLILLIYFCCLTLKRFNLMKNYKSKSLMNQSVTSGVLLGVTASALAGSLILFSEEAEAEYTRDHIVCGLLLCASR